MNLHFDDQQAPSRQVQVGQHIVVAFAVAVAGGADGAGGAGGASTDCGAGGAGGGSGCNCLSQQFVSRTKSHILQHKLSHTCWDLVLQKEKVSASLH